MGKYFDNKPLKTLFMKLKRKLLKKPLITASLAIAFFCFLVSNATISPVMANGVKKLAPIQLDLNGTSLTTEIFETLGKLGYSVDSAGYMTNPYTITVSLNSTKEELNNEKLIVTKQIEKILAKRHIDNYKIKIEQSRKSPPNETSKSKEINKEMMNIFPVISKTMKRFGYDTSGIGYNNGVISIDLPNTVKRKKAIKQAVEKALMKKKFEFKKVEFNLYNESKRLQESRWNSIISIISDNLIGKSDYKLKDVGYRVQAGKTYISLNTGLDNSKDKAENVTYLKETFEKFFALNSTKVQIQKDPYKLIIYGKNKQFLVKIEKN
ncbi:hypothetical protein ACQKMD_18770 [Viridibacillus sp. NPDC096237]|uniref:hypothetical protein n=1 Tax=Viridibacillus sp. NPDC096237 TaxID=3390721 RepID=UPI003D041667